MRRRRRRKITAPPPAEFLTARQPELNQPKNGRRRS